MKHTTEIPAIANEPFEAGCLTADEATGYFAAEISRLRYEIERLRAENIAMKQDKEDADWLDIAPNVRLEKVRQQLGLIQYWPTFRAAVKSAQGALKTDEDLQSSTVARLRRRWKGNALTPTEVALRHGLIAADRKESA